ncbi:unnamed protein product [Polarella glacialis]|uniref:Uncharacterized protein n=1 Tax=Polarella glacialis TaxID=89957 RepID=A0A813KEE0_POLGL|nr:unnamed protein product [Polarella glacialis]
MCMAFLNTTNCVRVVKFASFYGALPLVPVFLGLKFLSLILSRCVSFLRMSCGNGFYFGAFDPCKAVGVGEARHPGPPPRTCVRNIDDENVGHVSVSDASPLNVCWERSLLLTAFLDSRSVAAVGATCRSLRFFRTILAVREYDL